MIERLERRIHVLEKQVPGFLGELEKIFGRRDTRFEFGRILLGEGPHIYFQIDSSRGPVDIYLTKAAVESQDELWDRWQLAHECLHLIDPHEDPTNVLEEGLATWYQNTRVPRNSVQQCRAYVEAEGLVKPFMNTLPVAIRRIRKEHRLAIGDIPANVLIQYCPEVYAVAQELTRSFRR